MNNKPVPCPYCGNRGIVLYKDLTGCFHIKCGRYHCDIKFEARNTKKEECIKQWNANADSVKKLYEKQKRGHNRGRESVNEGFPK